MYADSVPEAIDAFAESRQAEPLAVIFPEPWRGMIAPEKLEGADAGALLNPRPGYQHDPTRRYGFNFDGLDVRFTIDGDTLTVVEVVTL